jgi:hypothetical protein
VFLEAADPGTLSARKETGWSMPAGALDRTLAPFHTSLPVATTTRTSSWSSNDSDRAEEQKTRNGEHHQMPWLNQIKQIPHSDPPRAIVARNSHVLPAVRRIWLVRRTA